jgi:hypothetical protein
VSGPGTQRRPSAGGDLRRKEEADSIGAGRLEEASGIRALRRPGPGAGGGERQCVAAVACEISGVSGLGRV